MIGIGVKYAIGAFSKLFSDFSDRFILTIFGSTSKFWLTTGHMKKTKHFKLEKEVDLS